MFFFFYSNKRRQCMRWIQMVVTLMVTFCTWCGKWLQITILLRPRCNTFPVFDNVHWGFKRVGFYNHPFKVASSPFEVPSQIIWTLIALFATFARSGFNRSTNPKKHQKSIWHFIVYLYFVINNFNSNWPRLKMPLPVSYFYWELL